MIFYLPIDISLLELTPISGVSFLYPITQNFNSCRIQILNSRWEGGEIREHEGRENDELKLGRVFQICELHVLLH